LTSSANRGKAAHVVLTWQHSTQVKKKRMAQL